MSRRKVLVLYTLILKNNVNLIIVYDYIEKIPLLFIDVKLGEEKGMQRLVLYDEDDPKVVAKRFGSKFNLSETKIAKLETLLNSKLIDYRQKNNKNK